MIPCDYSKDDSKYTTIYSYRDYRNFNYHRDYLSIDVSEKMTTKLWRNIDQMLSADNVVKTFHVFHETQMFAVAEKRQTLAPVLNRCDTYSR